MTNVKVFLCAFAALYLTACASVDLASSQRNEQEQKFLVQPGKANIYTVQAGGFLPDANTFQVTVDGQSKGSLAGWTYHVVRVDPGVHTVIASTPESEEGIEVFAKEGQNYFVGLTSKIGLSSTQVSLRLFGEAEGKQAVLNAKLAKGLFSGN